MTGDSSRAEEAASASDSISLLTPSETAERERAAEEQEREERRELAAEEGWEEPCE